MRERLRKLWPLVKLLLGLAIIILIGRRFYLDLRDNPDLWRQSLRPGWLLLAGALYLLGMGFWVLCWHRLLRGLGQRPPFLVTLRAYYIGQMGKYLPGKAWVVFLRGSLLRGQHATPMLGTVTSFYETLITMSAGVLVAAVLFFLILPPGSPLESGRANQQFGPMIEEVGKPHNLPIDWQRIRRGVTLSDQPGAPLDLSLLLFLTICPLVPLLLTTLPPVFNWLVHHLSFPFRERDAVLPKFRARGLVQGLVTSSLGWLCLGGSLWALLQGTLPEPPPWKGDTWGSLTAIMGLSYVAGFVVLLAPGGLGVREFFLVLFLVALLRYEFPADKTIELAVVVLRLVWTAAELVMIALVWKLPGPPVLLRKDVAP
jgi:glycosyltransferase 2 family protein